MTEVEYSASQLRLTTWQENVLHSMFLTEKVYCEMWRDPEAVAQFDNTFLRAVTGSEMGSYHHDRMQMLEQAGWIYRYKIRGMWHYRLTESGRRTLTEHMRYAAKGITQYR